MSGLLDAPRFRLLPQRRDRPSARANQSSRASDSSRDTAAAPGRARRVGIPRRSSAFFLTGVIFAASLLGVVYLVEITRVASLGYTLSTLRDRQARLEHDQAQLAYQVSAERTLAQVDHLARGQYGMRSIDRVTPEAAAGASAPAKAAAPGATPVKRFLTVQRPAPVATPTPAPTPAAVGFGERLWHQLAGIGVAGDRGP